MVATQNPVDLDYKALTNAGVWGVGRLSTERDKERLLDGLDMVAGGAGRTESDRVISGLEPRQFLFRNVHEKGGPVVFSTRWALSYLRGPLTRDEVRRLVPDAERREWTGTPAPGAPGAETGMAGATKAGEPAPEAGAGAPEAAAAAPQALPPGIVARYLDPSALRPDRPRGAVAGAKAGPPRRYRPALLGRATVRFDERGADLDHSRTEWRLLFPLEGSGGWRWPEADAPDLDDVLGTEPIPGVPYEVLPPALELRKTFSDLERDLKKTLLAVETLRLFECPPLKTWSTVGETREAFAERVRRLASDEADREAAKLRDSFAAKQRKLDDRVERERMQAERARAAAASRKQETAISVGESLLGMFLGGRRSTRVLSSASRKGRMAADAAARAREQEAQARNAEEELQALNADLARELQRLDDEAAVRAEEIREVPVSLERDDVRVEEVSVLWVPDAS